MENKVRSKLFERNREFQKTKKQSARKRLKIFEGDYREVENKEKTARKELENFRIRRTPLERDFRKR